MKSKGASRKSPLQRRSFPIPRGFSFAEDAEPAAYSPFARPNTHLVYTTEHLRPGPVERTRFFGCVPPEKSAYALRIGQVGLVENLDGERVVLDSANLGSAIRVIDPDDDAIVQIVMPTRF